MLVKGTEREDGVTTALAAAAELPAEGAEGGGTADCTTAEWSPPGPGRTQGTGQRGKRERKTVHKSNSVPWTMDAKTKEKGEWRKDTESQRPFLADPEATGGGAQERAPEEDQCKTSADLEDIISRSKKVVRSRGTVHSAM
ncbi:hypothetical protein AAFF_G00440930 [Aldrovandia affinis]|uniref:Uncharacterized protein n=1 Tax=Aldrovandia affinis TaxID=143900 RepID=A0AAD7WIH2_9TELE|nr:hypothetical protein AAFF_G00440930 [Aldrovandia affinis]